MKKKLLLVLVVKKLLLLIFALCALNLSAKDTVKIGVILPLTGNNANLGEACMEVLKVFEADLAQKETRHEYKFIVEDDQMMGRLTAQAANKLLNIDHVRALCSFASGPGNVVAPMTEQKKILNLCAVASDTNICGKHEFSFLHWLKPSDEMADYVKLLQALKIKRLAYIGVKHQGAYVLLDEFKRQAPEAGIEITAIENFNPGERDFRVQLAKIKETKPEAIFPLAFSPELQIILRRMKELGLPMVAPTVEVYDFIEGADAPLVEGQYYISAAPTPAELQARAQEVLGRPIAGYAQPQYYSTLQLLVAAFENSPTASPIEARDFLASLKDYRTILGTLSCEENRLIPNPTAVYQIRGGKAVEVGIAEVR